MPSRLSNRYVCNDFAQFIRSRNQTRNRRYLTKRFFRNIVDAIKIRAPLQCRRYRAARDPA